VRLYSQSGTEGTDGSVGLKAMPIDSVTLSDAYDPGERAQSRQLGDAWQLMLPGALSGVSAADRRGTVI
jgi:hypothetical protein